MFYCEVEFISSRDKIIIFSDEDEAMLFYDTIASHKYEKNTQNNFMIQVKNNDKEMVINMLNVETVSKPKIYIDK